MIIIKVHNITFNGAKATGKIKLENRKNTQLKIIIIRQEKNEKIKIAFFVVVESNINWHLSFKLGEL